MEVDVTLKTKNIPDTADMETDGKTSNDQSMSNLTHDGKEWDNFSTISKIADTGKSADSGITGTTSTDEDIKNRIIIANSVEIADYAAKNSPSSVSMENNSTNSKLIENSSVISLSLEASQERPGNRGSKDLSTSFSTPSNAINEATKPMDIATINSITTTQASTTMTTMTTVATTITSEVSTTTRKRTRRTTKFLEEKGAPMESRVVEDYVAQRWVCDLRNEHE